MIMLDWDKEHIFEDMCNEMAGKLKEDGLPIVAWGDTTEEMFVPFFERYGLSIDNICDKDNGKQNIVRNLGGGINELFLLQKLMDYIKNTMRLSLFHTQRE